jgi:formate-dependent nitrite reductase cytochrome c552 subunit
MFKILLIVSAIFCFGLFAPNIYAKNTCLDCHKNEKFRIQNKKLFDYYNMWRNSVHEIAGIKCIDCHGGDPTKTDKDDSHKKAFTSLKPTIKINYKKIPTRCGRCHKEVLKNFMGSKHYKSV